MYITYVVRPSFLLLSSPAALPVCYIRAILRELFAVGEREGESHSLSLVHSIFGSKLRVWVFVQNFMARRGASILLLQPRVSTHVEFGLL